MEPVQAAFGLAFVLVLLALLLYPQPPPDLARFAAPLRFCARCQKAHRRIARKRRRRRRLRPAHRRGTFAPVLLRGELLDTDSKHDAPPLELRERPPEVPQHVG